MSTPRTDAAMAAMQESELDLDRVIAFARLAMSMMEFDLNKAREEADSLREKLGHNAGLMTALEIAIKRTA